MFDNTVLLTPVDKKRCFCCNGENTEMDSVRVNEDDGFCSSSRTEYVCKSCWSKNVKATEFGEFLKTSHGLYVDQYGFGAYEKVRNKAHLDRIFNRDYYELLEYV